VAHFVGLFVGVELFLRDRGPPANVAGDLPVARFPRNPRRLERVFVSFLQGTERVACRGFAQVALTVFCANACG
jgi:hypothetical protein